MEASKYSSNGNMVWQLGNRRVVLGRQLAYEVRANQSSEWRVGRPGPYARNLVAKVEAAIK
jgi:hypothetical protein